MKVIKIAGNTYIEVTWSTKTVPDRVVVMNLKFLQGKFGILIGEDKGDQRVSYLVPEYRYVEYSQLIVSSLSPKIGFLESLRIVFDAMKEVFKLNRELKSLSKTLKDITEKGK